MADIEPGTRETLASLLRPVTGAAFFVAAVAAGFVLKYFQGAIMPLVLALFLLLLIDALSRRVGRFAPNLPEGPRLLVVALLIVGVFLAIGAVFAARMPVLIGHVIEFLPRLDSVAAGFGRAVGVQIPSIQEAVGAFDVGARAPALLGFAGHFGESAMLTLIYLGFMMASRGAFGRKLPKLVTTEAGRRDVAHVFAHVRDVSESYMLLQTVKATLISVPAGLIMVLFGVQDALFIAFLIFVLSYVPLLGAVVSVILPAAFVLAQFPDLGRQLGVTGAILAVVFVVDHFVMPKLQSDKLNLDPVALLLSLGFWGVMLGAPGALLSTPLTVVVMTVAAEFRGTRWLAVMLSKEGEPPGEAEEQFVQQGETAAS